MYKDLFPIPIKKTLIYLIMLLKKTKMESHYNYIIIGAGICGVTAIKTIREVDSKASILLISNEDRLPYKRTKINKLLCEGFSKEDFALHPKKYYDDLNVQILYDEVIAISSLKINTANDKIISFDKVLIATGKKPKTLRLSDIPNHKTHHIYTAKDSEKLINKCRLSSSFLVVGGGVEGIEMTDQLFKMGKKVTLIHDAPHALNKHLSPTFSIIIESLIIRNNIEIIIDEEIETHLSFIDNQIRYTNKSSQIDFDEIVICIGSAPNHHFANYLNVNQNNGILVNKFFQTSAPNVFAAGDVAVLTDGTQSYLWHSAEYQGIIAGKNMTGEQQPYQPKTFRLKCEVFGCFIFSQNKPILATDYQIVNETSGYIHREIYLRNNEIAAIIMLNDKTRSKDYEKAINERWSLKQLNDRIPL
jgi:NAD(P)H-nitrite reductase large subunit